MSNKRIPDNKQLEVKKLLSTGMPKTEVAKKTGISYGSVCNIANGLTRSSQMMEQHLRKNIRDLSRKYTNALSDIRHLQKEIGTINNFEQYASSYLVENKMKPRCNNLGEAIAFIVGSDWHIDEVVNSAEVNDLNKFDLTIAESRLRKFWESSLSLLDMCRSRSHIDTLVLTLLGDLMSGWIHEEYIELNDLTPPEAALWLFERLVDGITFLCDESKAKEVIVVAVCGNHSRITKKLHTKNFPKKSYEWLVYKLVARWLTKTKRNVRFLLPSGYFSFIDVYNKKIRIHHGNNIQFLGGVGGIHIPLRKAIAQWNKAYKADYDILGHWHTREMSQDYLINGSLIGWNEWSIRIKADYQRPQQSFFIWHPRYGATAHFPIVLEGK